MALCYIAHAYGGNKKNIERAKRITRELQKQDLANCYICPLMAFSHLEYGEIGHDDEMELCLDLLTCADKLIVASEISNGVRKEIDFSKLVKMEVMRLDENGELRPFAE
jgi:hypothetical protein